MNQRTHSIFNWSFKKNLALIISLFSGISMQGQVQSAYSILVAGHAYGAHTGVNIGLHPPFLEKLKVRPENVVAALFLTGDIVNHSTTASWTQVERELADLHLPAYYVMGNHDNNPTGLDVFTKKHGGPYYSFAIQNELYIVLNSTESDRSISAVQLQFLNETLQNSASTHQRVFIFFHEVIWNSHEKYKLVRSNMRSRYTDIVKVSNFWEKVYPALGAYPDKEFYLFAGDVGGNPDAIAAFCDRWENVTLLASGMGEVRDENYLEVTVLSDTVLFKLIPLNDEVEMQPITWYSVPEKPQSIQGPAIVDPPQEAVKYEVVPIFNATTYKWSLGNGIMGSSTSTSINLSFDANFQTGQITASVINDGFGESEPAVYEVQSFGYTAVADQVMGSALKIHQTQQSIQLVFNCEKKSSGRLRIYNLSGSLLYEDNSFLKEGMNTREVDKRLVRKGLVLIELLIGQKQWTQKVMLY